jgi:hypothetical protein
MVSQFHGFLCRNLKMVLQFHGFHCRNLDNGIAVPWPSSPKPEDGLSVPWSQLPNLDFSMESQLEVKSDRFGRSPVRLQNVG